MDASRDIMESAKPPRPPRPGRSGRSHEEVHGEGSADLLRWTVAACAVAAATFTGITAWETHQDRVNTEVIYCNLFVGIETDDDGDPVPLSDQQQRMVDQLDCG